MKLAKHLNYSITQIYSSSLLRYQIVKQLKALKSLDSANSQSFRRKLCKWVVLGLIYYLFSMDIYKVTFLDLFYYFTMVKNTQNGTCSVY